MTWAKIKLWCFHNWKFLVIGGAIVLAYLLGGKKVKTLQTQLQMSKELYKKEVEAIDNASDKKTELQAQANDKYKRALDIAHKTAMESSDHIELVKAERVRRLVEENKENPDEIDRILSKEFGIILLEPRDKS